jgi:hypothetical protein
VKLTTHLHLVPRSRKCGCIHPLPHKPSWGSAELVKRRDSFTFTSHNINRDSSVDIAMGYRLEGRGSDPRKGKRFFSTPQSSGRLWIPPGLLSYGYHRLFLQRYGRRSVKLTTHLHLAPRLRITELYLHSCKQLHGVVLSPLSTGTLQFLDFTSHNTRKAYK